MGEIDKNATRPCDPALGLTFEKVRISLDGRPLIELDRHVPPGKVLTVMGPSGVGKSTLLSYAAGFLTPAFLPEGRVLVDGHPVTGLPAHARHMGLLFQDPLLFPHMSVGENIAFALPPDLRGRAARKSAVHDALESVGLAGFHDRDPMTLSGGQKARVALVRVLASQPRALLARRTLLSSRRRLARPGPVACLRDGACARPACPSRHPRPRGRAGRRWRGG